MFFHVRRRQWTPPRARAAQRRKTVCAPAANARCARAEQMDMDRELLLLPQHFGPNLKEYLRQKLIDKVGLLLSRARIRNVHTRCGEWRESAPWRQPLVMSLRAWPPLALAVGVPTSPA
eukprot:4975540-Prymnesium_polylepis.1